MNNIIELINNNNWIGAINKLSNPFDVIDENNNLFHFACLRGNKEIIQKYLDMKSDFIYNANEDGDTGIHILAKAKWDDILINIISKYPNFLILRNNDDNLIANLVMKRMDTLKKVLNVMLENNLCNKLNYVKSNGGTFALYLVKYHNENYNSFEIFKMLDNCLDLEIPNEMKPLIFAIIRKKYDLAKNMLSLNIYNNSVNLLENTIIPLENIIEDNQIDLLKELLKRNININFDGKENNKLPINLAIKYKNSDIIKLLVESNKLDYTVRDGSLNTPVFYLLQNLNNLDLDKNIVDKFIQKSNLHSKNINNITPNNIINSTDSTTTATATSATGSNSSINSNSGKIKLPKEKISNFGTFNADGISNILYLIYLLKKYKNVTIPIQSINEDKQIWDFYKMNIEENIPMPSDIINIFMIQKYYCKYFYCILPFQLMWANKTANYMSKNKMYLRRAIKSTKRFVIMRLSLVYDTSSHANIIMYDTKNNELLRFEPYGETELATDSYNLDNTIMNMFKKCLDENKKSTLKYYKPSDFLSETKFQTASLGDNFDNKKLGDPLGYCLAWCYWFVELKLNNPDINNKILVDTALQDIISKDKTNKNPLLSHIRSYANNLTNEKIKIFNKMGIDKDDHYNLTFNEQLTKKISDYVNKNLCDLLL